MINTKALDNPVWNALNESHQQFARNFGGLKFYDPDIGPFAAFDGNNRVADEIDQYSTIIDDFFVVGDKPEYSAKVNFVGELVCLQMICEKKISITHKEEIHLMSKHHNKEVQDLVSLVMPGYFKKRTMDLGEYFGIFQSGQLVAVTGERMKMDQCTEVSAVVTHPDHSGKGYAKELVAHTVNNIFDKNELPFLHVAESNQRAISVYEKLGFKTRRKMSFWRFQRR